MKFHSLTHPPHAAVGSSNTRPSLIRSITDLTLHQFPRFTITSKFTTLTKACSWTRRTLTVRRIVCGVIPMDLEMMMTTTTTTTTTTTLTFTRSQYAPVGMRPFLCPRSRPCSCAMYVLPSFDSESFYPNVMFACAEMSSRIIKVVKCYSRDLKHGCPF